MLFTGAQHTSGAACHADLLSKAFDLSVDNSTRLGKAKLPATAREEV